MDLPIHGVHIFRQSHVAANIEKFVEYGVFSHPQMYNKDETRSYFDMPFYQWGSALLSKALALDPLFVARLLSVLCIFLTALFLDWILKKLGAGVLIRLVSLFAFLWSPLILFYGNAPLPDLMAISLATLSLYAFLLWRDSKSKGLLVYAVFMGAAVLSCLIKIPVYFPFAIITMGLWILRQRGSFYRETGLMVYAAVMFITVAGYSKFSSSINYRVGNIANDFQWYFGTFENRLDMSFYEVIVNSIIFQVLGPGMSFLALLGLSGAVWRVWKEGLSESVSLDIFVILSLLATLLTIGVFFNLHFEHNYYQLPFVALLCVCAGMGFESVRSFMPGLVRKRKRAWLSFFVSLLMGGLLFGYSLWHDARMYRLLSAPSEDIFKIPGEWLQSQTTKTDFIIYVHPMEKLAWNPAFLYFAKRDGFNLVPSQLNRSFIEDIARKYRGPYDRILVYCAPINNPAICQGIQNMGFEILNSSRLGILFKVY